MKTPPPPEARTLTLHASLRGTGRRARVPGRSLGALGDFPPRPRPEDPSDSAERQAAAPLPDRCVRGVGVGSAPSLSRTEEADNYRDYFQ